MADPMKFHISRELLIANHKDQVGLHLHLVGNYLICFIFSSFSMYTIRGEKIHLTSTISHFEML
jgi:hypothetical protein